jgi:hypothetical protein
MVMPVMHHQSVLVGAVNESASNQGSDQGSGFTGPPDPRLDLFIVVFADVSLRGKPSGHVPKSFENPHGFIPSNAKAHL